MRNAESRDKCITALAVDDDNLGICFQITTQGGRDECVSLIAVNRVSFDDCEEIKSDYLRTECLNKIVTRCNSLKQNKWASLPADCDDDAIIERNIPEHAPEGTVYDEPASEGIVEEKDF